MQAGDTPVGGMVARARLERGLTQAQLAQGVGLDRSALAKIETGVRRVSALELVAFARELDRRVEWFLSPAPEAITSYRASAESVSPQAIDVDMERVARHVEFILAENPAFLPEPLAPMDRPTTDAEADLLAAAVRQLLGLRNGDPATDLDGHVTKIGLLAFSLDVGDGADGATVLLKRGGVTIINGDRDLGRRRLTLAHEIGHYVVQDEYASDWRIARTDADALEARLDRFARALLLPADDFRTRWAGWAQADGLRDAAVFAGSHYRVDMATLARRLLELGCVSEVEAAQVRRVQTKKADIIEKGLLVPREMEAPSLPVLYQRAVLDLYRREFVSAARALDLLLGTFDADALPSLPTLPEDGIWAVTS